MNDESWKSLGPRVMQRDFPVLVAAVREIALEKLLPPGPAGRSGPRQAIFSC